MQLTDADRETHLLNAENDARALLRDIYEKLDAITFGPSREVTAAVLVLVVALYARLNDHSNADNLTMLAELQSVIEGVQHGA